MKKKTALICLLTALSATTIAVAAGCGTEDHAHSYSWKYDSAQHWQECECGDKKGAADHADTDSNGKCDVCQVEGSSVTFDMKGHGTQVPVQVVFMNGKAVEPDAPEEDGWNFVGWFTDADCTEGNEYDFDASVSANVTLYASWTLDRRAIITFDVQGHGTAPKTQKILPGDGHKVVVPDAPTADGCTFGGWYVDAACTVEYDFDDEVTDSMTIFAKWNVTVTFSTVHGTAPAAQTVKAGSKVDKTKIIDPTTDEDLQFIGWYSDADCTKLFDFNAEINSSCTAYAKWIVPLPQLSVGSMQFYKFGSETQLQFAFTATVEGRYCFSLGAGNSSKCTFTSDVNSSIFNKDNNLFCDLSAGQSVVLTLFRGDGVADDANVRLDVALNVDEDLPSEGWVNGTYTDGTVYLKLNGKNVTVDETPYTATYVGGSFNMLIIKMGEHDCIMKATDVAGAFTYTYYNSSSKQVTTMLNRFVPVQVSEISGVYTPNPTKVDNIGTICIYESGNGYYMVGSIRNNVKLGESGSYYDSSKNELHYGSYTITPVLNAAGTVTGLSVTAPVSGSESKSATYTKESDAPDEPPAKLPLPDDIELVGATYSIKNGKLVKNDVATFNYNITITAYDKTAGVYTILASNNTFTLEIEGEGDEVVVKLYNDTHSSLLDTLAKKVVASHDLKMDGTENEVTSDMVSNNFVTYTIPKTGVYTVTMISASPKPSWGYYATLFYADYENDPYNYFAYMEDINTPSSKVVLQQGNVFAINLAEYGSSFASLSFTLTEAVADPGTTPDNPIEITTTGTDVAVPGLNLNNVDNYYVTFTAAKEGDYNIKAYYTEWGSPTYKVYFEVDNIKNGFVPMWAFAYGGDYYKNGVVDNDGFFDAPYATVHMTAGQTVTIVLNRNNMANTNNIIYVNVEEA